MEIPEAVLQRQAQQELEDEAGIKAAGTALPGALRDAWEIVPEIKVGPYSIRPFTDKDYTWIQMTENPIRFFVSIAYEGKKYDEEHEKIINAIVRGRFAWEISFILTTPPKELRDIFEKEKIEGFQKLADEKFSGLTLPQLGKLVEACIDQMNRSSSTMIGYGSPKENEESATTSSPP